VSLPRNTFAVSCMTRMWIDLPRDWLPVEWSCRSLGFAPTASRGRRDDKGEGGASMEAWLVAERTARTLYVPMFRRTLI
jgi:hypothetical protein